MCMSPNIPDIKTPVPIPPTEAPRALSAVHSAPLGLSQLRVGTRNNLTLRKSPGA